MTLQELLAQPLPPTYRDFVGMECPIPYPKRSRLLARCVDVYLFRRNAGTFVVVYGLQPFDKLSREDAATTFGQCCLHQATCAGLLS